MQRAIHADEETQMEEDTMARSISVLVQGRRLLAILSVRANRRRNGSLPGILITVDR